MTDHTRNTPEKSTRLMSLDALRGFDMFCIIGGGSALRKLMEMPGEGFFPTLFVRICSMSVGKGLLHGI